MLLTLLLLTGCTATVERDGYTRFVKEQYTGGLAQIHASGNFIQAYDGDEKISGVIEGKGYGQWKWKEINRTPRRDAVDASEVGTGLDIVTSLIGVSQGYVETNPLGLAIIPLKLYANEYAETLSQPDCLVWKKGLGVVGYAGAAANICVMSGVSAGCAVPAMVAAIVLLPDDRKACHWLGVPVK